MLLDYRILVVEDDRVIADVIASQLSRWGLDVKLVTDFERVLAQFNEYDPQLVLMDITLPFYSGFYWCAEIRRFSKVPVIFISSAADNMNIVTAINMGGDDFIAKPFDLGVLTAKVQAMLRRSYDFAGSSRVLSAGELMLNLTEGKAYCQGKQVELTRNELKILQMLMENRPAVVSRDDLMTRLWESDAFVDENTLAVNVARLRKKLTAIGAGGMIQTRKGMGYSIE
ncbi:MAG TPA: response regulator transcription factor [Candidatus Faecivivens stercoripullorum]|uniref:Stage 0 sporulation protein A homolog n=1 Tax=Candidatus Faecivivens stercoripullorum TaxID=2840805 RepID=A0A9D1KRG2_9FIRM|nr:response regulator transcription factor [Candidatus Faecivivens stercoripullorum]